MKNQIEKHLVNLAAYSSRDEGYLLDVDAAYKLAQEISELDFWQPIETAPRDGTWIQGWGEGKYLGIITYCSHYGIWVDDVDNVFTSKVYPISWQPIPNSPKQ